MKCPTPITIKNPSRLERGYVHVPCGKCNICLKNRSLEWSVRLQVELKHAESAFFLTLTYSDECIPRNVVNGNYTLLKSDVQKFLKRLRNRNDSAGMELQLRYYLVGEYGDNTRRPHYHIIVFNLSPKLLKYLEQIWTRGHVHIGNVETSSIMYVTNYILKLSETPDGSLEKFSLMSKRPAIGHQYLEKKTIHSERKWNYFPKKDGVKGRLPRYYKDKFFSKAERKKFHNDFMEKKLLKDSEKESSVPNYFAIQRDNLESILQKENSANKFRNSKRVI